MSADIPALYALLNKEISSHTNDLNSDVKVFTFCYYTPLTTILIKIESILYQFICLTSVLSCLPKKESIDRALVKLYSKKFQDNINKVVNPYGLGGASKKIVKIIKNTNLDNIVKKSFFNLKSDF